VPITEDIMRGMFEHVYRARKEPPSGKRHIVDHGFTVETESAQRPRDQIIEDSAVKRRKLTESTEVVKARKARKAQEKAAEKEEKREEREEEAGSRERQEGEGSGDSSKGEREKKKTREAAPSQESERRRSAGGPGPRGTTDKTGQDRSREGQRSTNQPCK
jgi:hypothetical protein